MKRNALQIMSLVLFLPWISMAQEVAPETAPTSESVPATTPESTPTPTPEQAPEPTPAPTPASFTPPATPIAKGEIRLNFQNAALADVLNYLSEAAGFVIVQEMPITGSVNIVSRQSISMDEAVDLLNAVLIEKGFTAIRNGRILKIVSRTDAVKRDIPVMTGSDPTQIPRKDDVVTQILPVRYVEVAKLVDNLRPLLSENASISANEASNAILLADTQANIHRMAEIIHALDTSISSISSIKVYTLQYADAKSLATVISQLFVSDQPGGGNQNNPQNRGGRWGGPPPQQPAQPAKSLAQQAATRVVAVADEQSNSVIVSAPDEMMVAISDIVQQIDTDVADVTETQIFRLKYADATELTDVIMTVYSENGSTQQGGRQQQQQNAQRSQRAALQARVVAVADPRTNSVVVSAAHETMVQIAASIERLDSTDSKKQHVYVHRLENADPDNVASILRGMFSDQNGNTSSGAQPTSSRLNQRTSTGARSDGSNILGNSGNNSGRSSYR